MFVVKAWKKDMTTEGKDVQVKFGKSTIQAEVEVGVISRGEWIVRWRSSGNLTSLPSALHF
jgi:hypothetical protein